MLAVNISWLAMKYKEVKRSWPDTFSGRALQNVLVYGDRSRIDERRAGTNTKEITLVAKIMETNVAVEQCLTYNNVRLDGYSHNLQTVGDAFHCFISEFSFLLVTGLQALCGIYWHTPICHVLTLTFCQNSSLNVSAVWRSVDQMP